MNKNQRFAKHSRLRKRMDFFNVYESGARYTGRLMRVFLLKQQGGPGRLGISVSRKVGNAVLRNRIKRVIREYFRQNIDQFAGWDIVIDVRPQAARELDKLPVAIKDHVERAFRAL